MSRFLVGALGLSLAVCAGACGSSGSGSASSGGAAGSSGAGGGGGGSGGSAGSPGKVTLTFEVPSSKTYCQQGECGASSSIAIKDASGTVLLRSPGDCYTPCDTCQALPCPGYACQPQGYAVKGESFEWDGTYWKSGTCGASSSCLAHQFATPGKYTAVMCATPGTLETSDATQVAQCVASGPAECVEVPFDFPTSQPVIGKLPG